MKKVLAVLKLSLKSLNTGILSALILMSSAGLSPALAAKALFIGANDPGPGIEQFSASQLKSGGAVTPVIIGGTAVTNATGVAFDKQNNLWVTTLDVTVLEYTHKQLKQLSKSPNPDPAVLLTSTSFKFILSDLFDKRGNLWIVDAQDDGIHEISKAQLKGIASGPITPAVDLSDTTDLASPAFAIFDKSGNLWISNQPNNKLVMFAANQITASNANLTGTVVISSPSVIGPGQMQFDKQGTLWVTNTGINNDQQTAPPSIVGFTKDQLTVSGSPTANIVISSTTLSDGTPSLDVPWGQSLDSRGNLWVFNYTDGELPTSWVSEFAKKDLKTSGAPLPLVTLTGLPRYSAQLTFGPPTK